jgi:hypothetical protein
MLKLVKTLAFETKKANPAIPRPYTHVEDKEGNYPVIPTPPSVSSQHNASPLTQAHVP